MTFIDHFTCTYIHHHTYTIAITKYIAMYMCTKFMFPWISIPETIKQKDNMGIIDYDMKIKLEQLIAKIFGRCWKEASVLSDFLPKLKNPN